MAEMNPGQGRTSALEAIALAEKDLPAPPAGMDSQDAAESTLDMTRVEAFAREISLDDRNSITVFGSSAQKPLNAIVGDVLANVRSRDVGAVGDLVNNAVLKMRGLDFSEATNEETGFFGRLLGKISPAARFLQSFETIESQIDGIETRLNSEYSVLLEEVARGDLQYKSIVEYIYELNHYIRALEIRIDALKSGELAAAREKLAAAPDGEASLLMQSVRDLEDCLQAMEIRLGDLRMTRQAMLQSAPRIRAKQAADSTLAQKINSLRVNGIPLWRLNVAEAIGQLKTKKAAEATQTASDFGNDMLVQAARQGREAVTMAEREAQRGLYDLESVKTAHQETVAMFEEVLAIRTEARARREAEYEELRRQEAELRDVLLRSGPAIAS